jgi:hypothetical protein
MLPPNGSSTDQRMILSVLNVLSDFFLTDLRLPPLILDETSSYTWRVRHRNQHGAASDPVSGSFTTAVWAEDGDANGIPDNQEVLEYLDLDNNGQRDQTQTRMKCLRSIRGDVSVAIDGAKSPSVVALSAVQAVDNLSLDSPFSGTLTLPIGLLAFKVITAGAGNSVGNYHPFLPSRSCRPELGGVFHDPGI